MKISGYDAWGNPVEEVVEYEPPPPIPRWRRAALWLCRRCTPFRWNVAYRLGLTRVRNITSISVV